MVHDTEQHSAGGSSLSLSFCLFFVLPNALVNGRSGFRDTDPRDGDAKTETDHTNGSPSPLLEADRLLFCPLVRLVCLFFFVSPVPAASAVAFVFFSATPIDDGGDADETRSFTVAPDDSRRRVGTDERKKTRFSRRSGNLGAVINAAAFRRKCDCLAR